MVAGGYAWYIAKFERMNWVGLLGNWLNGAQLYDTLSNLLSRVGDFNDVNNKDYTPAAGYWIYQYYQKSMTGYRVTSTPTSDGNCDVFGTVGTDKVRLLTSCHFSTTDYTIQVKNLASIGYPANGSVTVNVTRFNSTSSPSDPIGAPYGVGSFVMQINNGVGVIPVFPVNTNYAYAFEWAR